MKKKYQCLKEDCPYGNWFNQGTKNYVGTCITTNGEYKCEYLKEIN